MQKHFPRILGVILAIIFCLGLATPMAAATDVETDPVDAGLVEENPVTDGPQTPVAKTEMPISPRGAESEEKTEPTQGMTVVNPDSLKGLQITRRPSFTSDNPPDYRVLNAMSDSTDWGDEQRFIEVTNLTTNETRRDAIILTPGTYEIRTYVHNCYGEAGTHGVYVTAKALIPTFIAAGYKETFGVILESDETTPSLVGSYVTVLSRSDLTIGYVDGTASFRAANRNEASTLSPTNLFDSEHGSFLGQILAGEEYAVTMTFTIVVTAPDNAKIVENDETWSGLRRGIEELQAEQVAASPLSSAVSPLVASILQASVMLAILVVLCIAIWKYRRWSKAIKTWATVPPESATESGQPTEALSDAEDDSDQAIPPDHPDSPST